MRLFIAIEIPDDVKDCIASVGEKINNSRNIRFVSKNQMHLTLKFLGEVSPDKLNVIKERLKKIKFSSFSFYLDSIGVFPNEDYIRVIWVGLKPEDKILELQKNIDESLKKLFDKEKNFKAHVTVARVKFIENKKEFLEKLKKIRIEKKKIDVDSFKLIKSTLNPEGPVYEVIGSFKA